MYRRSLKKIAAAILSLLICFSVWGCGQSEAAAAAQKLETAIEGIGTVSLEKQSEVADIRKQYNQASDEVQAAVKNYDVLVQAEQEISNLKVEYVVQLIQEIGDVSLESEEKIRKAQTEYNSLTNNEKEQVTNYSDLTAANDKLTSLIQAEKERILQEALEPLLEDTDKVQGITWYLPSALPWFNYTRPYVLPYLGIKGESAILRIRYYYTGEDWIFFDRLVFAIDGETYYKSLNYSDINRDTHSGDVWEGADIVASSEDLELLQKIADSKETIIRFQGDRIYDLTVSDSDKTAIKQVLTAYEAQKSS